MRDSARRDAVGRDGQAEHVLSRPQVAQPKLEHALVRKLRAAIVVQRLFPIRSRKRLGGRKRGHIQRFHPVRKPVERKAEMLGRERAEVAHDRLHHERTPRAGNRLGRYRARDDGIGRQRRTFLEEPEVLDLELAVCERLAHGEVHDPSRPALLAARLGVFEVEPVRVFPAVGRRREMECAGCRLAAAPFKRVVVDSRRRLQGERDAACVLREEIDLVAFFDDRDVRELERRPARETGREVEPEYGDLLWAAPSRTYLVVVPLAVADDPERLLERLGRSLCATVDPEQLAFSVARHLHAEREETVPFGFKGLRELDVELRVASRDKSLERVALHVHLGDVFVLPPVGEPFAAPGDWKGGRREEGVKDAFGYEGHALVAGVSRDAQMPELPDGLAFIGNAEVPEFDVFCAGCSSRLAL